MNVCKSLSILLSGMLSGPWKNQVITFEEKPRWVELDDTKTLFENQTNKLKYRKTEMQENNRKV